MNEPVATVDGNVYEKAAIRNWFRRGNRTSPKTDMILPAITTVKGEVREVAPSPELQEQYRQKAVVRHAEMLGVLEAHARTTCYKHATANIAGLVHT